MFSHRIKSAFTFFKPTFNLLGNITLPILYTVSIWDTLDNLITILIIALLIILIIKNLNKDADLKIVSRIKKTRVGKVLFFLARTNVVTKVADEEYMQEVADEVTDKFIKPVIKTGIKIQEEFKMKEKIKALKHKLYLLLKHNKKNILGYLSMILIALDRYFGISIKYGLPVETANWVSAGLFTVILAVMGGEGWTGNVINQIRENKVIAKHEGNKKTKEPRIGLAKAVKDINKFLKKYAIGDLVPQAMRPDYNSLLNAKRDWEIKIDTILKEVEQANQG